MYWQIGDNTVKRGRVAGLAQQVTAARELGAGGCNVSLRGIKFGFGLGHAGLVLRLGRHSHFVRRLLCVVIGFGNELAFVQTVCAVVSSLHRARSALLLLRVAIKVLKLASA